MYGVKEEDVEEEVDLDRELMMAMPAIRAIAAKVSFNYGHRASGMIEDLVQIGTVGFMEASRRYRPMGERTRSEYALSGAKYAIYEGLRRSNPNKRAARVKAREINRLAERLTMLFGRKPTSVELASTLRMRIDRYHRVLAGFTAAGLANPVYFRTGEGKVADPVAGTDDQHFSDVDGDQLKAALAVLPDKEREVVELAFFSSMRLEDIGYRLGHQKSYVSKLRKRGLEHLAELLSQVAVGVERRNRVGSSQSCRPSLERAQPDRNLSAAPSR